MKIEVEVSVLKNLLNALLTTHAEVNVIFNTDPVSVQFVSSKYECIMYWNLTNYEVIEPNEYSNGVVESSNLSVPTTNSKRSETIHIDKILKVIAPNTTRVCIEMLDHTLLIEQRYILCGTLVKKDISQFFTSKLHYLEKHNEMIDYITEYYTFKSEFPKEPMATSLFDIKILERMINTSINYTTTVDFIIDNDMMTFRTQLGDSLVISSSLISDAEDDKEYNEESEDRVCYINDNHEEQIHGKSKLKIVKRMNISSLNLIKSYKKISHHIYISYSQSQNKEALIITPVGNPNTELVLFFT